MRHAILILCVFAVIASSAAQNKPERMKQGEKVSPLTTKKTVRENNSPSFLSSLKPIDVQVMDHNRKYAESVAASGKQLKVLLRGASINQRTHVSMAENVDAMTILNAVGKNTGRLSYYTNSNQLKWEKNLDFSKWEGNLSSNPTRVAISSNGKRVAVYELSSALETESLVAVYDDNGNLIPVPQKYIQMSPSGNYFYSGEAIYDSRNKKSESISPDLISLDLENFAYEYQSRIFKDDILAVKIRKMTKSTDRSRRQVLDASLFLIDLNSARTIYDLLLMNSGEKDLDISLSDRYMSIESNHLMFVVHELGDKQVYIQTVDLTTKHADKTSIERLAGALLSNDGKSYLVLQKLHKGEINYSFRSFSDGKVISDRVASPRIATVTGFRLESSGVLVLYSPTSPDESSFEANLYSLKGSLEMQVHGWFSLTRHVGALPVFDHTSASQINVVQTNLEVK